MLRIEYADEGSQPSALHHTSRSPIASAYHISENRLTTITRRLLTVSSFDRGGISDAVANRPGGRPR
ncbi:protein of unknown function [Micropruina glycogenica]|uniref:Uncharacterized protein n=1 Tax=Micropruina glycogenica TaxID=75385 RepID=A0A2N9JI86_9ACTN|nr:protein of unknown function [Micropruina glycogenica]